MRLPNNLKYKELRKWYQQQPDPKPNRIVFRGRVLRYGYSPQEALEKEKLFSKAKLRQYKVQYNDNGRVCNKCKQYKKRDEFSYNKVGFMKRNGICKVCKNKDHAEYRLNGGKEKDQEYKDRKRHLKVGDQIYFHGEIREVTDYKSQKGYGVKSIVSGERRRICTADNVNRANCVKFRKLVENVVLEQPKTTPEITLDGIPKEEKKFSINLDEMLYGEYE